MIDNLPAITAAAQDQTKLTDRVDLSVTGAAKAIEGEIGWCLSGGPGLAVIVPDFALPAGGIDVGGGESVNGPKGVVGRVRAAGTTGLVNAPPASRCFANVSLAQSPNRIGAPGNASDLGERPRRLVARGDPRFHDHPPSPEGEDV